MNICVLIKIIRGFTAVTVHPLDRDSPSAKHQLRLAVSALEKEFLPCSKNIEFTYSPSEVIQGRQSGDAIKKLSLRLLIQLNEYQKSPEVSMSLPI